jgi:hypothetical protein
MPPLKLLTSTLLLILTTSVMASESSIIGNWKFLDSSLSLKIFPESCRETTYTFTNDGLFVIDDGSLEIKKSYTSRPQKNGYFVEVETISTSGRKSCQGVPASNFKSGVKHKLFAEVLNDGRNLKISFDAQGGAAGGFYLLEKIKQKKSRFRWPWASD